MKHTLGMCYHITNVFAFGLSILAFEISTIMHQQLVTVLQGDSCMFKCLCIENFDNFLVANMKDR